MPTRIYIDGAVVERAAATISVFDRGFLFGDSVFETVRIHGGVAIDLAAHLDRLHRSATAVAMHPPPREAIAAALAAVVVAAAEPNARARIILSRGEGEWKQPLADFGLARLVILVEPLALPMPREIKVALTGQVAPAASLDPGIKSGGYLPNLLAVEAARRFGADEAIRTTSDGDLADGATSSVFVVKDGHIATPALAVGILAGVTRFRVIDLCRQHGLTVAETRLPASALRHADEAFITSSIRGVVPISAVDGAPVARGPVGEEVREMYEAFLARSSAM